MPQQKNYQCMYNYINKSNSFEFVLTLKYISEQWIE